MLSQNQKSLEKQLQCLGISIAAKTESAPIQAYRVHLISRMENVKMLTGYEGWGKQDNAQPSRKQAQKSSIQVGKGLKDYLFAIFTHKIESYIHKEVYLSALEEIQQIFNKKREQIISKFTPKEATFYEKLAHFYELNKEFTYFSNKSKALVQNTNSLMKLDIFSLILLQNEDFYLSFENYKIKDIFPKTAVMKVLNLGQNQIEHFKIMFRQMRQFISLDFFDQFKDIISIFCFIELKHKLSTYYLSNTKKKNTTKNSSEVILLKKVETKDISRIVKFRFSQLALIQAYNWPILKTNTMLQSKVISSILAIPKNIDERSLKEELLSIKIKLNLSLKQVCFIYDCLHNHQMLDQVKNQLQKVINIYQWKYLTHYRFPSQISNILESEKCRNCNMVANYFLNKIQTRYAIERFELTAKIAERIKKIMRDFPGHQEVFIHYFTYSFIRKEDKAPKVFVSLILATKGNDIFFEVLFPFKLVQHQFFQFLMRFFEQIFKKTKQSYEINLYSFNLRFSFPEQPLFKLINFLKKATNSYVLPLNCSTYFQKHFLIDKAIKMRLFFLSSIITEENFYSIIKMILIQMKQEKAIHKFHDKVNIKSNQILKNN